MQALRAVCRSMLEEGAAVAAVGPRDRGHAGQRADAGAAGEAEQHGLGLVVAGVAEQDGGGAVAVGGVVQGGVAGVAGGGLGAAVAADGHGDGLDRVEAERGQAQRRLRAARRSEPGCRPWSTVMPPARRPSLGASKARAEASAMESAPPEQATSTSGGDGGGRGRSSCGGAAVAGAVRRGAVWRWRDAVLAERAAGGA